MNEVNVLDKLISLIGNEWDNHKDAGCPSLKPIGVNYKGVFKGDPMTIPDFPCVGVIPDSEDFSFAGNQYFRRNLLTVQIPFYSYDMEQEDNVDTVIRMAKTIMNVISANPSLGNLVGLCTVKRFAFNPMIKYGFEGVEIRVMGGAVEVTIDSYDSEGGE